MKLRRQAKRASPEAVLLSDIKKKISYCPETGIFKNLVSRTSSKAGAVIGHKTRTGYTQINICGSVVYAHRLAWFFHYEERPVLHIDHINGDRSDNRICNFRQASKRQNAYNSFKPSSNSSGCKGVYLDKRNHRWHATLKKGKKHHSLGLHDSFFDAVAARKSAELKLCEGFSK